MGSLIPSQGLSVDPGCDCQVTVGGAQYLLDAAIAAEAWEDAAAAQEELTAASEQSTAAAAAHGFLPADAADLTAQLGALPAAPAPAPIPLTVPPGDATSGTGCSEHGACDLHLSERGAISPLAAAASEDGDGPAGGLSTAVAEGLEMAERAGGGIAAGVEGGAAEAGDIAVTGGGLCVGHRADGSPMGAPMEARTHLDEGYTSGSDGSASVLSKPPSASPSLNSIESPVIESPEAGDVFTARDVSRPLCTGANLAHDCVNGAVAYSCGIHGVLLIT